MTENEGQSEIGRMISSGHLYHEMDCDFIRRLVCGKALCIRREDDQETAEAAADELGSWVARKVAQRDARIVELEAQVAAFRAPAEAAGYTVSADGKCWTGNGGGREFVQGPPINVAHREEPAPWMAAMARDARCPECLGMMRKRGMTEEPEEQCSEPVAVMMRVRCHAVVRALDSTTTLHTYTDADGPCCEINCGDQVSFIGAAHETLALREAVRLVAMRDGRYDAATDRVDLAGLEVE